MATNPLLRYGPPRQIACTLGISGEFPNYISGAAYTGTVAINGAQGETRVELVPPGTDANGGAYIPLVNGDFAGGSTSWSVQTQTASPGFSFQSGAGRSGPGFLRWQCSGPMGPNDADVVVNTSLVRTTERTTTGRFWARCTAIGTTTDTIYAQVAVQMQVFADAAGTQLLGSYLLGFLRFFEVLTWRPVVSSCPTEPGQYVRFSIWIGSGVAATLEFDDCEWDARGIPSSPPAALALPAGFTIDTQTSPDRVRVQWPAVPVAGASATSLLNLNGVNGSTTFTDLTGKTWARTGTAVISTAQSKYGGASLSLPTGSSGISTTATIPNIMPGTDFCIEFWLYAGPNTGDIRVAAKVGGAAGINAANSVLFYKGSPTDGIISVQYGGVTIGSPGGFTDTGFVHVAFAVHHNGGGYNPRLFVDGVLAAGGGTPAPGNFPEQINFGSTSLWLGDAGTGRGMFGGFIDDFRLTIGSPVYTANFTPPGQLVLSGGGPAVSTLANLDFEAGDVNWLKGAGWAITNAAPVDAGSWSAKYTGLGQSNIAHETLAPVTPGTSITASCRVSKGNNRQDFAGGAVLLQWFDANTRIIGFNVGNVINTGSSAFQTSSVTATAPTGAAFVRIGASGSRDVKGRATDAVAVDGFTWNHTFALGGSGGSGGTVTPTTGPVTLSFRVTDSVGCSAVATRTISQA